MFAIKNHACSRQAKTHDKFVQHQISMYKIIALWRLRFFACTNVANTYLPNYTLACIGLMLDQCLRLKIHACSRRVKTHDQLLMYKIIR